jgi:hypothetical protein
VPAEVNIILAEPKMKARLGDLGGVAVPISPAKFAALIAADTGKWGKVVRFSGAKPD